MTKKHPSRLPRRILKLLFKEKLEMVDPKHMIGVVTPFGGKTQFVVSYYPVPSDGFSCDCDGCKPAAAVYNAYMKDRQDRRLKNAEDFKNGNHSDEYKRMAKFKDNIAMSLEENAFGDRGAVIYIAGEADDMNEAMTCTKAIAGRSDLIIKLLDAAMDDNEDFEMMLLDNCAKRMQKHMMKHFM